MHTTYDFMCGHATLGKLWANVGSPGLLDNVTLASASWVTPVVGW